MFENIVSLKNRKSRYETNSFWFLKMTDLIMREKQRTLKKFFFLNLIMREKAVHSKNRFFPKIILWSKK